MLKGYTKIDLLRNGKVVHRVEKHNVITGFIGDILSKGNYGGFIPSEKIYPLNQWFDGCILTDKKNPDNDEVSGFFGMIAPDAEVIACAGNSTDAESNLRRGTFEPTQSGVITGGYRFVWAWPTARGNGIMNSVGLTRSSLALAEFSPNYLPAGNPINEIFYDSTRSTDYFNFSRMQIVDYDREVGFYVSYANDAITVNEYKLGTYRIRMNDRPIKVGDPVVHTISQTISNPSLNYKKASLGYTKVNNVYYIHFITWDGSKIKDYVIDTSTWQMASGYGTSGIITRTYSGVTFIERQDHSWNQSLIMGNLAPVIGDYIYMMGQETPSGGSTVSKIYKCNLLDDEQAAQIIPYENPLFSKISVSANDMKYHNGACCVMPNGDFYKTSSMQNPTGEILYFHNDKFNLCRETFLSQNLTAAYAHETANNYGTTLVDYCQEYQSMGLLAVQARHGWLSTVNNLDEAINKTADLQMVLTYEITEVTS